MEMSTDKIEMRRNLKKINKKINELKRMIERKKACVVIINNKLITVY